MPQQITAWQAADGSVHDNECAAAERDVDLMIEQCGVDMTPATATALKMWAKGSTDEIISVLRFYGTACPQAAKEEAAPESPKGPVALTPHWTQRQSDLPIPKGMERAALSFIGLRRRMDVEKLIDDYMLYFKDSDGNHDSFFKRLHVILPAADPLELKRLIDDFRAEHSDDMREMTDGD